MQAGHIPHVLNVLRPLTRRERHPRDRRIAITAIRVLARLGSPRPEGHE